MEALMPDYSFCKQARSLNAYSLVSDLFGNKEGRRRKRRIGQVFEVFLDSPVSTPIWNMIKQRVACRKTCMNNICYCCPLLLVFLSTSISVLYSILGLCTKVPYPQLQPPTKQAAFCPLQRDKKSQMK